MTALPRAILFDLDDTILCAYGPPGVAWTRITEEFAAALGSLPPARVAAAIGAHGAAFWRDPAQHKYWRFRLEEARRRVVEGAFAALAAEGHAVPDAGVAAAMADRFSKLREAEMHCFPGAVETIDRLKDIGVKLALVTNGAAEPQRAKVTRFALEHRFDHIQIEGEHGFGKPEEQAYRHAMGALGVGPKDTWMVGDHLEWEVAAPQRLGIYAIWLDAYDVGLPPGSAIRPDRIIRSLPELL
ncbi:MAG TPA: HAD family hydrolase [Candidatus Sulfotelmatobacter sp.]|nr:HAD family hydrolase [Candidatus Sulfotelmatobacter sp.]